MADLDLESLKKSAGFRQYDPGVFTNDESFGKGQGYVVDSGPTGYKQVALSSQNIGQPPPPTTPPPPTKPDAVQPPPTAFVPESKPYVPQPDLPVPPKNAGNTLIVDPGPTPAPPVYNPPAPTAPAAPSAPSAPNDWSTVDAAKIAQYFASRNTTPRPTSVDYWVAQWPALVARGKEIGNPNYAYERLQQAEEFGGGGTPTTTTTGTPTPTAPAGAYMTPEGTWITAQYDPGVWIDNKNQLWMLDANGKPVKKGAGPSGPTGPTGPTNPTNPTGPAGPGKTNIPGVPIDPGTVYPGNNFNDQGTQLLEDTIKARLNELFAPVNDPSLIQLNKLITDRLNRLQDPASDPAFSSLMKTLTDRISALQAPVYSAQQEEAVKTGLFDQMEQDRQSEIKSTIERLAARGGGRDSGTIQAAVDAVNRRYDAARAQSQNQFATSTIAEQQRRADEATQLAGTVYDANQAREGQALSLGSSLYDLSNGVMDQEKDRRNQALGLISTLADIPGQRLQLAEQAAGMQVNPASISDQIMKLLTNSQTQTENAANRRSNLVTGIGQIVGSILAGQHAPASK